MSGMIFELAVVEDRGSFWQVANVTKNTLDGLANRHEKMLKLSYSVYNMIQEALLANKVVRISKTLCTDEVLPWEITVIEPGEENDLQSAKDSSLAKVRMLVTPELSKISGFTLYGFMVLNNDMNSAGYFITDQTREETYLKILETGDEKLISKLEDYLNYKDEIDGVAHLERKFSAFKTKIKEATSADEVKQLEQQFLDLFYASK